MSYRSYVALAFAVATSLFAGGASATGLLGCGPLALPKTTFVQFNVPNIDPSQAVAQWTIKGKLSIPVPCGRATKRPAVLILHGSAGVDSRGDFYQQALNATGIATLQIDMWEARGVTGVANRPSLPVFTYPDAFGALAFLSAQPDIDANRVGVLGFSWGGVVSLAASEQLYAASFGGGRKFKAHVANYPVCYGANNAALLASFGVSPAQAGTQYLNPTGAPVLIQIGSKDGYDNGTAYCKALAQSANASRPGTVTVAEYAGAFHAWDRIMIPVVAPDPFANEGSFFSTGQVPLVQVVPDVDQAHVSLVRVVSFFRLRL